MRVEKIVLRMLPVTMVALLVSCSNGTSDNVSDAGMASISANGMTDTLLMPSQGNATADTDTLVSGRVADGYIQGATVCVDLNNSETCDADEPSALTGVGGSYALSIPADAQDKPLLADIPANAIDEDTGDVVGKPLVFIAPATQPVFISPMTTLVHQELKGNPALSLSDAENTVKSLLGVSDDVSLFEDYVTGSREGNGDTTRHNELRVLHDNARVLTSMMKGIESEVRSAAMSMGVDVTGSDDTQHAIRDIARRQLRQLLPAIAKQVADMAGNESPAAANENTDVSTGAEFNPEAIALALRPDNMSEDVLARINAVVERPDPVLTDIRQLLMDGVYWVELDCYYKDDDGPVIAAETKPVSATSIDYVEDDRQMPTGELESCVPFYGKVRLNTAGDELIVQNYIFDAQTGLWVEEIDQDEELADFFLVDGQWEQSVNSDSGPQGRVEFTANGSAIITNAEGVMRLGAVTRSLDGQSIKKYFYSDYDDPAWFELLQSTDVFPSGSLSHGIGIKQSLNPYVLFNVKPYADSVEAPCAEYADNCNVIGNLSGEEFVAMKSLDELRQGAVQRVELVPMHSGIGPDAKMTFMMDGQYDGALPDSGSVTWSYSQEVYDDSRNHLAAEQINEQSIVTRWRHVEVDGIELIEIQRPNMFGFSSRNRDEVVILAEHNGFVRLGERLRESFVDRVSAYNKTALMTLRTIIENADFP